MNIGAIRDAYWRSCLAAYLVLTVVVAAARPVAAQQMDVRQQQILQLLKQRHDELHTRFAAEIEQLIQFCEQRQFTEAAARLRQLSELADRQVLRLQVLPATVRAEIPAALPKDERAWRTQLQFHQSQYAQELHLLARRVMKSGHASFAFQLIREAAFHDPDNRAVRALLGQIRYEDRWVTPFAAKMLSDGFVWNEKFGWIRSSYVERYENGERFFQGKWISAQREAEIRRDFRFAWEIRTEHYLVHTNHSLERGVEIAAALEDFYRVFVDTFAGFFNTPEQMQQLFQQADRRNAGHRQQPHQVHFYREKAEYVQKLKPHIPQIEITNGLYYTTDRTAYFFHDPNTDNLATLFHEATHQLFYESDDHDRPIAVDANFWIVEGIACYMESFERRDGRLVLGNPNYTRFYTGRYRYLVDEFYIPLQQFAGMGMQAFQSQQQLARSYSQASSLAHFLMHYDGGRFRDALVEHLSQIYRRRLPRGRVQSLPELAETDFATLDRQYGEYVRALGVER